MGADYGYNALSPSATGSGNSGEHLGRAATHRVNLFGMAGVTTRLNALAILPYMRWSQRSEEEDVHHRSETLQGFQDLQLGLRYILTNAAVGPGRRIFLGVNVAFPTAPSYSTNPFDAAADTVEHRHFALGTGATGATLYGEWWQRSEFPWVTGLLVRYTASLKESSLGFQPGPQLGIDLHAIGQSYRLWHSYPYLIVRTRWQGRDIWANTSAPNSGGYFLEGSAGLNLELTESVSGVIRFSGPLWSRVRGAQQLARGVDLTLRFMR